MSTFRKNDVLIVHLVDRDVNIPEERCPRRFMVDRDVNLPEERCPRRFRVDRDVNFPEKRCPRRSFS